MIDNTASADAVRPLLPGAPGCGVIVTSRDPLTGLTAVDGATRLVVRPLSAEYSLDVLRDIVGAQRVRAEVAAATDLATLCGGLPLALRVAAANLAGRRDTSIAAYHAEMVSGGVLDALQIDGDLTTGVRATLASSYDRLTEPARRLLRLLGVPAGADVTVDACAALLGSAAAEVAPVLAELCRAHILESADGRYSMHDLVRAYATEIGHGTTDIDSARRRLLTFYVSTARSAAKATYPNRLYLKHLPPGPQTFDGPADALAWLDAEVANIVAESQRAAVDGPWSFAWEVCDALAGYFWLRRSAALWAASIDAAAQACEAAGNGEMALLVLNRRGIMHWARSEYDAAEQTFLAVGEEALRRGDHRRNAGALGNLGGINRERGRFAESIAYSEKALEFLLSAGDHVASAACLINLSTVANDVGDYPRSLDFARRAEAIYRTLGDAEGTAASLMVVIDAQVRLDTDFAEIDPGIQEALAIYRGRGAIVGEAALLSSAASAVLADGRIEEALTMAERANVLVGPANNPSLRSSTLLVRGRVRHARGDYAEAMADLELSESEARRLGVGLGVVEAVIAKAAVALSAGDVDRAYEYATEAFAMAQRPPDVAAAERMVAAATPSAETSPGGAPAAATPQHRPKMSRA